jgi:photosystem II stability/assembly factor-like uncharacterized protein
MMNNNTIMSAQAVGPAWIVATLRSAIVHLPRIVSVRLAILLAVLVAMGAQVCPQPLWAQQTGEWVAVDGRHPGYLNIRFMRIAAAGRGDYVVVAHESAQTGPYAVRRTTDAGASWQVLRLDSFPQFSTCVGLAHPSPNRIIILVDSCPAQIIGGTILRKYHGLIFMSSDGGATWTRTAIAAGRLLRGVAMCDDQNGLVAIADNPDSANTSASLLRTHDGGVTWEPIASLPGAYSVWDVSCINPHTYVFVVNDIERQRFVLHRSTDGGGTWNVSEALPDGIRHLDFVDSLHGWGAGAVPTAPWAGTLTPYRDRIAKTNDGGMTWSVVIDSQISPSAGFASIDFADAVNGIAVGPMMKILRTTDGGQTWIRDWPPAKQVAEYMDIGAVAYPVPGEALACGLAIGSYVVRYTGGSLLAPPMFTQPDRDLNKVPASCRLAWTAVEGATSYDLQIGDTAADYDYFVPEIFDDPVVNDSGLASPERSATLQYNTRYVARVRARNATQVSNWSMWFPFITMIDADELLPPHFTSPAQLSAGLPLSVTLEWSAVPGATEYHVAVATSPYYSPSSEIVLNKAGIPTTTLQVDGLHPNTMYFAKVQAKDATRTSIWSNGNLIFMTGGTSGVGHELHRGTSQELSVYPNPSNGRDLRVRFQLPESGPVRLRIVNTLGEVVRCITDWQCLADMFPAGEHEIAIDMTTLPNGAYYIVLEHGGYIQATVVLQR